MKMILFCLVFVFVAGCAYAADKEITARFAYNGGSATEGFRLYVQHPGASEPVVLVDVADPTVREINIVVDLQDGRSFFSLTAYTAIEESLHSEKFPFEFLDIPSLPAPTVLIQFTN